MIFCPIYLIIKKRCCTFADPNGEMGTETGKDRGRCVRGYWIRSGIISGGSFAGRRFYVGFAARPEGAGDIGAA